MSINTPHSSDIPLGFKIDKNYISFGGVKGPSLKLCYELRNPQTWDEHKKVLESWIENATPEEIFKYLRGDYNDHLNKVHDNILNKKLKYTALEYIWSKTPELQEKYPNFEGISCLRESDTVEKAADSTFQADNSPWILLSSDNVLEIYTRGGEADEFTMHFYKINQDGKAECRHSRTQGEIQVAHQEHKTKNRVLDTLLAEDGNDHLKIASAFLSHATIAKASISSKKPNK